MTDDKAFVSQFAAWLKVLRKRLNMRQVDLAKVLGASVESVSRWELGQTQPYASNLMRLFALATKDEMLALLKAADVDDLMTFRSGDGPEYVALCEVCERQMRLRDFTTRGWPAPPMQQQEGDPYAIRRCTICR